MQRRRAVQINDQGVVLSKRGDFRGALAKYRQAAALDPNNPVIRNNIRLVASTIENEDGVALFNRGNYDAALVKYRRALDINSGNTVARSNLFHALGNLANSRGECLEAEKQYRAAIRINPSHQGAKEDLKAVTNCANMQRAELEENRRHMEQTAGDLKVSQAMRKGVDFEELAFKNAVKLDFADAVKSIKPAIAQFQEALKIRPNDKALLDMLAEAREALARYQTRQGIMSELKSLESTQHSDAGIARLRALERRDTDFVEPKIQLAEVLMGFKYLDPNVDTAGRIALLKEVAGMNLDGTSRAGAKEIAATAKRELAVLEAADAAHLPTGLMRVVPPPPEAKAWKTSFTDAADSPAVAEITQKAMEQLDEARHIAKEKLEEKGKETLEEKLKDKLVAIIPMSKSLKEKAVETAKLIGRFKDLYGEMKKATNDLILGWEKVTQETVACLASNSTAECDKQIIKVETVPNDYRDKASKWGTSWLREDLGAHK